LESLFGVSAFSTNETEGVQKLIKISQLGYPALQFKRDVKQRKQQVNHENR
jgi:hypothetical protein